MQASRRKFGHRLELALWMIGSTIALIVTQWGG